MCQERWLEEGAEYWTPQPSTTGSMNDKVAPEKGEGEQRYKKYMPFGDGMRACVGQSLAKMSYTAATALLLSHFTFRLAERVRSQYPVSFCHQCCAFANLLNTRSARIWLLGSIMVLPVTPIPVGFLVQYACMHRCMHARLEGPSESTGSILHRWAGQMECWLRRWRASRWRNATACGCMQSPDLWLLDFEWLFQIV